MTLSPLTTAAAGRYSKLMDDAAQKSEKGKGGLALNKPLPALSEKVPEEAGPVVHDVAQAQHQEGHWAVMPDDVDWTDWTQEEKVRPCL
jgi:hypothetical protein